MKMFKIGSVILSILLLAACGGGSDDNNDSTSTDSDTHSTSGSLTSEQANGQAVALSSIETAKSFLAGQNAPFAPKGSHIQASAQKLIEQFQLGFGYHAKTTETETTTEPGECGGSVTVTETTTTPDDPNESFPLEVTIDSSFDNYCLGDSTYSAVINGTLEHTLHYDSLGNGYQDTLYNINYTSSLPLGPYDGLIEFDEHCVITNFIESCDHTVNHEYNGTTYTLTDVVLSGDASSGYNLNSTLSSSTGDSYSVVVNNLTLCDNGNLQTGTLTITDNSDSSSVINIEVTNCDEVLITYMGDSWTVEQ